MLNPNSYDIEDLLQKCKTGKIKLLDFQRYWCWEEDQIKKIIFSVSRSFPIGALMMIKPRETLYFGERPIEGVDGASKSKISSKISKETQYLIVDGQQRITALYQACFQKNVIVIETKKKKKSRNIIKRWFYIDIEKILDSESEEAIISVPENRKSPKYDLSSDDKCYKNCMFPVNRIFDYKAPDSPADRWEDNFCNYWKQQGQEDEKRTLFLKFEQRILDKFKRYPIPILLIPEDTPEDAICSIFERINSTGTPLDVFNLLTAKYANKRFNLLKDWDDHSKDWCKSESKESKQLLAKLDKIEFLSSIAFLSALNKREIAEKEGKKVPSISIKRKSLLELSLETYKQYSDEMAKKFEEVARFLRDEFGISSVDDLPYHKQIIPLAVIFAKIGDKWKDEAVRRKISLWYWNGIFGEMYGGGSPENNIFPKDVTEVPNWILNDENNSEPTTIRDAIFKIPRLLLVQRKNTAIFKGIKALLLMNDAKDFRLDETIDKAVRFDTSLDIHHIFPQKWCKNQGISKDKYNSILNKTPLRSDTNKKIGDNPPSVYLKKIEEETGKSEETIDKYLKSHLIDPQSLRNDDFDGFFKARKLEFITMIEEAIGKPAYDPSRSASEEDEDPDDTEDEDQEDEEEE